MTSVFAPTATATDKRKVFRAGLESCELQRFPGAFSPLVATLAAEIGFDGIYVSGAALSADLGLPDIGLTTLTEVTGRAGAIARSVGVPTLVDADTGFGEPMNAARAVAHLEDAGLAGCHLEDQVSPKRCGHLDGKSVVAPEDMIARITAAVRARRDPDFVICARTDARALEGLDAAIDRAQAYVAAGADLIFTEALGSLDEFRRFRDAVDAPLLANMTEFGKSPLLTADDLRSVGYNVVIYPVTTLRLAMFAVEQGLRTIHRVGTQADLVETMQSRSRLYELLRYADYYKFDSSVNDFTLGADQ